ncbi:MAG: bacillithiol biosynthesis cysteine-adding enzyme BshC [Fluviicola sp.]|nr:bacillithiol biosynthesis cysteine-adding enzyme BshC [Fluviicola sp.]
MQVFKFHRNSLSQVNEQHLNLVYRQEAYLPYINHTFSFENFDRQIQEKERQFSKEKREVLSQSLLAQYKNINDNELIINNIESLKNEDTFTVTTGHQLSFFTGPLYFIVKILHVIKLSERLKKMHPEKNFVPIYWMATEDHDFEEVQSMRLFSKSFTWESEQKGSVGRFNLDGFDDVKNEIRAMFRDPEAEIHALLNAYDGQNYADATRNLVHFLFKKYGLVIIDGDDSALKSEFSGIMRKELTEQFSYEKVIQTNEKLQKEGVKIQVNPREINLFYIKNGLRERIVNENDIFSINKVGTFSESEILKELENHPERFSPNVILRPLYQETILPNIAYIGGVGEISYWLQLKGVFDAVNCTYPLIGVRNSVIWVDPLTTKKKAKINLLLEDIFKSKDQLKKEFVQSNSDGALDFKALDHAIDEIQGKIRDLVLSVDASMNSLAESEVTRITKQMDALKAKMIKTSKSKHQVAMQSIDQIIDKLFPDGNMQERITNFFSFCPDGNYSKRLHNLYHCIDPEEKDMLILREL